MRRTYTSCFNGAGVFRPRKFGLGVGLGGGRIRLQWGRGLSTPEMRCGRAAPLSPFGFNGAGVFRPRKSAQSPLVCRRQIRFNGAGVFRPRKCAGRRETRRWQDSFNGAGVFRPRKCSAPHHRGANNRPGFNGAGVFRPRKCAVSETEKMPNPIASMGPGSFDPGNQSSVSALQAPAVLQWGRGLSTPEIRALAERVRVGTSFNGAGVFRPRKSENDRAAKPASAGFNGAGVFRPRKCAHRQ